MKAVKRDVRNTPVKRNLVWDVKIWIEFHTRNWSDRLYLALSSRFIPDIGKLAGHLRYIFGISESVLFSSSMLGARLASPLNHRECQVTVWQVTRKSDCRIKKVVSHFYLKLWTKATLMLSSSASISLSSFISPFSSLLPQKLGSINKHSIISRYTYG